jgi:SAM-dependent methyltransferase
VKPLTKTQDAYGHAMLDAWRCDAGRVVIERSDGYIGTDVAVEHYLAGLANWSPPERAALRWARGRVLDVGCGAGRVALELQQRGCAVVGIDNSRLAIQVCRERGVKDARAMALADVDDKLGAFDTVMMYGNNFGLFGSANGTKRLLKRLHRLTLPGARLLAASVDPYQTKNPDHLAYHRQNRRQGRMAGQLRFRIRYRRWCGPWMDYLLVARTEMQRLVEETGWRAVRFCNWEGPTYVAILAREDNA